MILRQNDQLRIHLHAEKGYPEEVCGFLYGKDDDNSREILYVEAVKNERDDNRERRFLITSDEFRVAEEKARFLELDLIGIYHSHPDHPAVPSEFDREHALPFYSYMIVSVRNGKAEELRSWQLGLDTARFSEEQITMKESIAVS